MGATLTALEHADDVEQGADDIDHQSDDTADNGQQVLDDQLDAGLERELRAGGEDGLDDNPDVAADLDDDLSLLRLGDLSALKGANGSVYKGSGMLMLMVAEWYSLIFSLIERTTVTNEPSSLQTPPHPGRTPRATSSWVCSGRARSWEASAIGAGAGAGAAKLPANRLVSRKAEAARKNFMVKGVVVVGIMD